MNYLLIAGIILALVLIFLIIKFFHNAFKAAMTLLLILIIVFGVTTLVVIYDTITFTRGITQNENLFLLKDDNDIIAGFETQGIDIIKSEPISENNLGKYNKYYRDNNYTEILDDRFRVIIIERKTLVETEIRIKILEKIMEQDNLPDFLKEININNIDETTSAGFTIKLIASLRNDPLFLVKNYKNNNIEIYPKSITFKILEYIK